MWKTLFLFEKSSGEVILMSDRMLYSIQKNCFPNHDFNLRYFTNLDCYQVQLKTILKYFFGLTARLRLSFSYKNILNWDKVNHLGEAYLGQKSRIISTIRGSHRPFSSVDFIHLSRFSTFSE